MEPTIPRRRERRCGAISPHCRTVPTFRTPNKTGSLSLAGRGREVRIETSSYLPKSAFWKPVHCHQKFISFHINRKSSATKREKSQAGESPIPSDDYLR